MTLNVDSGVNAVTFSRDGTCIISGSDDNLVRVWDALTGKEKHVLNGHTNSVSSVAISIKLSLAPGTNQFGCGMP